jgi:cystathionine beta-lyase family protein involved in aluminum resistance
MNNPKEIEAIEKARERQRKMIAIFSDVPLQDRPKLSRTEAEEMLEIVQAMEEDLI